MSGTSSAKAKIIDVLVVDDEPLARRRLFSLCRRMPEIDQIKEAGSGREALDAIKTNCPDLVLLDIDMPDISGMEVADRCRANAPSPQIVFTTAHSKYAVEAFRLNATDYLLKPVKKALLVEALQRVMAASGNKAVHGIGAKGHAPEQDYLWVRDGIGSIQLRCADIERIEAEGDYMRLCLPGRSYLIHDSMHALESKLPPDMFVRIHRSTVLRKNLICEFRRKGRRVYVVLADGVELSVGPSYVKIISRIFDQAGGSGMSETVTE